MTRPSENPRLEPQALYRRLLHATAYPGHVADLSLESGGLPAWQALLQCLLDGASSLSDPDRLLDGRARTFLRARLVAAHDADFVLLRAGTPPAADLAPRLGLLESPELGATLILVGETIGEGPLGLTLQGPGVADRVLLRLGGVHAAWLERRARWVVGFPLGIDAFLCDSRHVAALPRTTVVHWEGP
jgi:alpha-D-ribose 1-methylphosphonate 5-triphosphate synthase subunit PhnH